MLVAQGQQSRVSDIAGITQNSGYFKLRVSGRRATSPVTAGRQNALMEKHIK
jgi:hypothetical protein